MITSTRPIRKSISFVSGMPPAANLSSKPKLPSL
jgi:hypothetical protein